MTEAEAREVLQLPPDGNISQADIKAALKRLAIRYHPDKNRGNPDAAQMMRRINMAKDLLYRNFGYSFGKRKKRRSSYNLGKKRKSSRRKGCKSKGPTKKLPAKIRKLCRSLKIKTTRKVGSRRVCKPMQLIMKQIRKKMRKVRRTRRRTRRRSGFGW
jgi:curved DNA-binding protein CbpA